MIRRYARINGAYDGNNHVVHEHCPPGNKSEVHVQSPADVIVCGARLWITVCHPSVAERGENHGDHGFCSEAKADVPLTGHCDFFQSIS